MKKVNQSKTICDLDLRRKDRAGSSLKREREAFKVYSLYIIQFSLSHRVLPRLKLVTVSLETEGKSKKNEVKQVCHWGRFHMTGELSEESEMVCLV